MFRISARVRIRVRVRVRIRIRLGEGEGECLTLNVIVVFWDKSNTHNTHNAIQTTTKYPNEVVRVNAGSSVYLR